MKQQVIVVHGGETFGTHDEYVAFLKNYAIDGLEHFVKLGWRVNLPNDLGDEYEVALLEMPSKYNAKYSEWKIWFDKVVPFIRDEAILVGHSLGGLFLAKYLSENDFPKKIKATLLISAPFDTKDADYNLADFILPENLDKFDKQGGTIIIYHSKDDHVVPFVDANKYRNKLSTARVKDFDDRGHFHGPVAFPEIIEDIKSL